jgi:hypothetical protein
LVCPSLFYAQFSSTFEAYDLNSATLDGSDGSTVNEYLMVLLLPGMTLEIQEMEGLFLFRESMFILWEILIYKISQNTFVRFCLRSLTKISVSVSRFSDEKILIVITQAFL